MNIPTKTVALKDLLGNPITFTLKTIISAFEAEQVDELVFDEMEYDENGKLVKPDYKQRAKSLTRAKEYKQLEIVITKWEGTDLPELTGENIKKVLSPTEFQKLNDVVEKIVEPEIITTEKKSDSQKS